MTSTRVRCGAIAVLLWCVAAAPAADLPRLDPQAAASISYHNDVRPILRRHCWGCHNGSNPKGGLNLDTVESLKKGGDSGPGLLGKKPDESLLIEMIVGESPEMPQKQAPLSTSKIQILRHWILAGAPDDSPAEGVGSQVVVPDRYRLAPPVASIALSPDGKQVAAACRSEVVLFQVESDDPPVRLPTESDLITHVEFSPDGALLAASGGSPAQYGEVRFYQAADAKLLSSRRLGSDTFFGGGFAPDGKTLALGGSDGAVHLIPVDPKAEPRKFDLHSDWVLDAVFTPEGDMIVSGGRDKATKVCDVATGELLRTLDGSTEVIHAVGADQQFAVSVGKARQLIRFEFKIALANVRTTGAGNGARPISTRAQYAKNFEGQPGEAFDIAASSDRKTIAVVGAWGDARVYTLENQQRIALITGLPAPVLSAALNGDGTRLSIGAADGQVQIYALPEGTLLKSLIPVPLQDATAAK